MGNQSMKSLGPLAQKGEAGGPGVSKQDIKDAMKKFKAKELSVLKFTFKVRQDLERGEEERTADFPGCMDGWLAAFHDCLWGTSTHTYIHMMYWTRIGCK